MSSDTLNARGGPWEAEADRICAAMVKRAPDAIRKASEALYEQMLYDVQDYLRENVEFNLSSQLAMAEVRAERDKARIAALVESLEHAVGLIRRPEGAAIRADESWLSYSADFQAVIEGRAALAKAVSHD